LTDRSEAPFLNSRLESLPGKGAIAPIIGGDFRLQGLQAFCRAPDVGQVTASLRDEPCNGLVMACDDDFLSVPDAVQEFAKLGFCLRRRNGRHIVVLTWNGQFVKGGTAWD
jgi:hypothetical protein